ncbi:hypothetical protein [Thiohalobacter thiocyanaticus]|uniref:Uncharacterized protein n=1 Tax=Thiohalobacter thiocyanaticus TaxID=585455 RepID=A0A426QKP6_9GAMM|nr:hypothetical protein [Thiohalobacter thiocyanaticus]RRQ22328.1 hypothetical protein D6C00_10445 [Thiohalobacter thiocyanaticus]
MRHHYRKPDPLVLLALFVGLGVVVTTGTLAVGTDPAPATITSAAAADPAAFSQQAPPLRP